MYKKVLCVNMDAQLLSKQRQMEMFNVQCVVPFQVSARKNRNLFFFFSCFLLIILHSWFGKAWKLEAHTRKMIYLFCMVEDFSWQGLDAGTIHHLALVENSP